MNPITGDKPDGRAQPFFGQDRDPHARTSHPESHGTHVDGRDPGIGIAEQQRKLRSVSTTKVEDLSMTQVSDTE
jgi:hypothetical protein